MIINREMLNFILLTISIHIFFKSTIEYVGPKCRPTNPMKDLNPFEKKIVRRMRSSISLINKCHRAQLKTTFQYLNFFFFFFDK
jgi:hypothetical protein